MRRSGGRRPTRLPQIAFLSATLLAPAGRAEAQVLYGGLVGRVSDGSQAKAHVERDDTPARALGTNVNGTARNNNNTRLDGAPESANADCVTGEETSRAVEVNR